MMDFLNTNMISKALEIVSKEFKDKTDKGGKPYIQHLIRVANNVLVLDSENQELLTIISLLHDLIEDTNWTEDDLRKEFPDEVVDAVVLLTKVDNIDYESYINNLKTNKLSILVKLSDLKDNMDITRLPKLGEYEIKRLKKYHKTYNELLKLI